MAGAWTVLERTRKMHGSRQLYARVMDLELRHLRCLVAIVDSGTFTYAAIELRISQAAVSRNLMALERVLGVRLLYRTSRTITPTTAGVHALAQARQVLAAADNLVAEATTGHTRLRIGHAWSAMGLDSPVSSSAAGRPVPGRRTAPDPHQLGYRRPGRGPVRHCGTARLPIDSNRFASAIVGDEWRHRAWWRMIPGPRRTTPSGSMRYRSALCSSTGAPGPPAPACGQQPRALHPPNPRHRRLAHHHRRRRRHRDHPRRDHSPVPARRRCLPAAARRRPADRRADDLRATTLTPRRTRPSPC